MFQCNFLHNTQGEQSGCLLRKADLPEVNHKPFSLLFLPRASRDSAPASEEIVLF